MPGYMWEQMSRKMEKHDNTLQEIKEMQINYCLNTDEF